MSIIPCKPLYIYFEKSDVRSCVFVHFDLQLSYTFTLLQYMANANSTNIYYSAVCQIPLVLLHPMQNQVTLCNVEASCLIHHNFIFYNKYLNSLFHNIFITFAAQKLAPS